MKSPFEYANSHMGSQMQISIKHNPSICHLWWWGEQYIENHSCGDCCA